jgi:transposase
VFNGMRWVLRTGGLWEDLPARYGPVGTGLSRFYHWRKAGCANGCSSACRHKRMPAANLTNLHFIDATVVRADQDATGARRSGAIGV